MKRKSTHDIDVFEADVSRISGSLNLPAPWFSYETGLDHDGTTAGEAMWCREGGRSSLNMKRSGGHRHHPRQRLAVLDVVFIASALVLEVEKVGHRF